MHQGRRPRSCCLLCSPPVAWERQGGQEQALWRYTAAAVMTLTHDMLTISLMQTQSKANGLRCGLGKAVMKAQHITISIRSHGQLPSLLARETRGIVAWVSNRYDQPQYGWIWVAHGSSQKLRR